MMIRTQPEVLRISTASVLAVATVFYRNNKRNGSPQSIEIVCTQSFVMEHLLAICDRVCATAAPCSCAVIAALALSVSQ
jgi:hypothetical protein